MTHTKRLPAVFLSIVIIASLFSFFSYYGTAHAAVTTFVSDSFTGTNGTTLTAHTPTIGGKWSSGTGIVIQNNAIVGPVFGRTKYTNASTTSSADYEVSADVTLNSAIDSAGVLGRFFNVTACYTGYEAHYDTGGWSLLVWGATGCGQPTVLGTYAQAYVPGQTYRLKLGMVGNLITLYVDGVAKISVTNNTITGAGNGGVSMAPSYPATSVTLDNFLVSTATGTTTDTQAPTVPATLKATPLSQSQINLSWATSTDNVAVVGYKVFRGGLQIATTTAPSFLNTGLAASATYSYAVSAFDAAGNVSAQSASAATTTLGTPDTQAPTVPAGLSAVATSSIEIDIAWNASTDNVGVSGYKIFRNGALVTTTTARTFEDVSLLASTTYSYAVSAFDAAGNVSALSGIVSATTKPLPPGPPPMGTWSNVTPANANPSGNFSCGNFGTITVVSDPMRPSNLYTEFNCQGIWKSTDFGLTWTGPINTGTNGATAGDCAGGIAIAPGSGSNPPTLYEACIRGAGLGFWKSTDGGVNWTNYVITSAVAQDVYTPVVDPYDGNHVLVAAHENNGLYQSFDSGVTWSSVPLNPGMLSSGTAMIYFINTGNAATTKTTLLYTAQTTDGSVGTWRTTNGGTLWTKVDNNEHPHGDGQIYQPDNSGVVYMAGINSNLGWGVLRSTDYGQTWTHVGFAGSSAVVFGTPNRVFSDYAWACGTGCAIDPSLQSSVHPGITGWNNVPAPTGMNNGPAQTVTVFDGAHYIVVGADWVDGLWRYVEPASGATSTPPSSPTGLAAIATSSNEIDLAWNTASAGSVAGYQVFRNGVQIATTSATSFADTGLTASTTYSYTVSAFDFVFNTSAQSAAVFATTRPVFVDTTAPTAPANLTITNATPAGVTFSWPVSTDNVGVTGYYVYKNGVQVATTTATTYTDSSLGLVANTFNVAAYDAAGNISAQAALPFTIQW